MTCAGNYLPTFQDQINANDPLGNQSCTTYSGAMAGDYDTCGSKKPTGKRVRELTGDKVGGTTLLQVDYALQKGWGINLDTRIGSSKLTWDQFAAKINKGYGAILQGSYAAIHGTKFAGDDRFQGNHAVFVPPGWGVMDPLCDGRRPSIYKYHGEAYPQDMLKRFAGLLMLDVKKNKRLGIGYVWCSLTRDNTIVYRANVVPKTGVKKKIYRHYYVTDGIIQKYTVNSTSGFLAITTAPKTYQAKPGLKFKSKRLVKIKSAGSRSGWYISATYLKDTV